VGRREEKREATRQDILAAAGLEFMSKGYENTSVDDIAARANVAKGTFYYHFKSKDEVLLGLSLGYLKRLNETVDLKLAKGEAPLAVLVDSLVKIAHDTEAYKDLSRHYFLAMFDKMKDELDAQYGDEPSSLPNIIAKIVRAAQARGDIDASWDAREAGVMIAGLSHHAQVTWIILAESRPLVRKVEDWVRVVLKGLAAD
jgi:AcrR family transcriptional regulator